MDENTLKPPEGYTNWNPSSPVSKKVLQLTELLHNILIYMPTRELLVTGFRVSKFWNKVILYSPLLQQKLHFQPMPLDKQLFEDGKPMYYFCGVLTHQLCMCRTYFQEPFTLDLPSPINPAHRHSLAHFIQLSRLHWMEVLARPEASWRKMLVVQPPTPFKHNFCTSWVGDGFGNYRDIIETKKYQGHETLGEVYEYWRRKDWMKEKYEDREWDTLGNHQWSHDTRMKPIEDGKLALTFNSWNQGSPWN